LVHHAQLIFAGGEQVHRVDESAIDRERALASAVINKRKVFGLRGAMSKNSARTDCR